MLFRAFSKNITSGHEQHLFKIVKKKIKIRVEFEFCPRKHLRTTERRVSRWRRALAGFDFDHSFYFHFIADDEREPPF